MRLISKPGYSLDVDLFGNDGGVLPIVPYNIFGGIGSYGGYASWGAVPTDLIFL